MFATNSISEEQTTATSVQILFTMSRKSTGEDSNKSSKGNGEDCDLSICAAEIDTNSIETGSVADTILCVLWNNGRIGAAYFNTMTQQLYILSDMIDPKPQFLITRHLLREINFKQVITMGTPCDAFIKFVIDLVTKTDDATVDSDQIRQLPANVSLLPFSEYSYTACQFKIFNLNLPSMPVDCSDSEKEVYFHSMLNFDNKLSVQALGALIKFTEINWSHLNTEGKASKLKFMHINQVSILNVKIKAIVLNLFNNNEDDKLDIFRENHVYIDKSTFQGLQIFQKRSCDAGLKHGKRSDIKGGESIFKLFSAHCKSMPGIKCLRRILLNPINEIGELKKRLHFIDFTCQISNLGFVQGMQGSIQKIYDIEEILVKIQRSKATTYDWELLYKTIYNTLFLYEQSAPYRSSVFLLSDLDSVITTNLYALESCIRESIDFSCKMHRYRPVVKFGVDQELDAKKMKRQDIGEHLTAAANFTINELPHVLTECTVAYIPEMGHLLVTKKNDQITDPNQLEYLGYQFMFAIHDSLHYKNAVCKELDKHLGHIQEEIITHEIRIIQRISDLVLKYNKDIREPLEIIALIDCLFAMATVAKEENFVSPNLNLDNIIEIKQGKHILLERQSDNIVPNDFKSGECHSKIKVITGPNACGKSVYLKQIALLVYLAHVGSYIPAEYANICMVYSIHSRIQVNESAAVRLSSFMIDLSQMSQILYNSRTNSLVIVDEFGKGTTGKDAMCLLAAALKKFALNQNSCPHMLVSTHLQQINRYLPDTSLLSYCTFDYMEDADKIVFLFKLVDGISTSFAFDVAQAVGLDVSIVNRAREIYKVINEETLLKSEDRNHYDAHNVQYYLNVDIPPVDD